MRGFLNGVWLIFFLGHTLDLIATFLICMQHNTAKSQSNMQNMLKRIKSE